MSTPSQLGSGRFQFVHDENVIVKKRNAKNFKIEFFILLKRFFCKEKKGELRSG
jgi:hypothetical protein